MSERRRPGQVRDAIVAYLGGRADDASVAEIQRAVAVRFGDQVASSSVRSCLRLNARAASGRRRLFAQTKRGRYSLLRE